MFLPAYCIVMPTCRFSDYDGLMLKELMKMKDEAPAALYSILKEEKMALKDMLKLNCALKQLQ